MPTKKPRTHAGGSYTKAGYFGFIRSGLRAKWTRYPPKYQVLNAAKRPYMGSDKRRKFEYQCNACKNYFPQKEVQVDHKVPCGSLKDYDDLPRFVERMFCEPEDLQVLCKPCHNRKTQEERKK